MSIWREKFRLGQSKADALVRGNEIKSRRGTFMAMVSAFSRKEDGAATLLALYFFVAMLFVAGLGIDFTRQEMERANLQATLDVAVLAAASGAPGEKTTAEIRAIVEDYFAKAGMSDYLNEIKDSDIVATANVTSITASAQLSMDSYLLDMVGIPTLNTGGLATAEISIPTLEISVVLDVSGSMRGTKLTTLQSSGREFVTTILDSATPDGGTVPEDVVMSIIPFSFGVTPPAQIFNALSVNQTHSHSTCLEFSGTDYSDTAIDPDTTYAQRIYTSYYGGLDNLSRVWRSCYNDTAHTFLAYSYDETTLHNKINALSADGNTSAHMGMKWGTALLDPAFDDIATAIDSTLVDVPEAFGERETNKIVVLMSDGANTSTYNFQTPSNFRGADSAMFVFDDDVFRYAYKSGSSRRYGAYGLSSCGVDGWRCRYTSGETIYLYKESTNTYVDYSTERFFSATDFAAIVADYGSQPVRLSWEEMWARLSPNTFSDKINQNTAINEYGSGGRITGSVKDTRLSNICTAAKTEGIVVYTIGFEVPAGGTAETALHGCASPNRYYAANSSQLSAVFASIANDVLKLRLTQ